MYTRLSTATYKSDATIDDVVTIWREQIIPLIRQQPGFQGVIVLGDRSTDKGASITLWESEEDVTASRQSDAMRQTLAALVPSLDGQPDQQHYEVMIQELT